MRKIAMLSLSVLIIMIYVSGCGSTGTSADDLLKSDVFLLEQSGDKKLVTSTTDSITLQSIYPYLFEAEPTIVMVNPDLTYELNLQTADELLLYTMTFDLANKKAIASTKTESYVIPFEWVNDYLTAVPLPEHFAHLAAPSFSLSINDEDSDDDGYNIALGFNQEWKKAPTSEVRYEDNYSIEGYEVVTRNHLDLTLTPSFSHFEPDIINITLIDNKLAASDMPGATTTFDNVSMDQFPVPTDSGDYHYDIECLWQTPDNGYEGTILYMFDLNIVLPVSYKINGDTYEPGDCIGLFLENVIDLDYRIETTAYDKTIGLFYRDAATSLDLVGLLPLSSWTAPGSYSVDFYQDSSNTLLKSIAFTVIPKVFEEQQLTVSSTTASLKSQENSDSDYEKFKDAKSYSAGEKLWDGLFTMPVEGRISTEYATRRFVNGGDESSRHNAIDIAAPEGTPILAGNTGVVTFASNLIQSGNTVTIDHGYGLFSTYLHMSVIDVELGQEVVKGEKIGEVGTTGYSTGPHLHYSLWKNGVFLNPWKFMEEDPLVIN